MYRLGKSRYLVSSEDKCSHPDSLPLTLQEEDQVTKQPKQTHDIYTNYEFSIIIFNLTNYYSFLFVTYQYYFPGLQARKQAWKAILFPWKGNVRADIETSIL